MEVSKIAFFTWFNICSVVMLENETRMFQKHFCLNFHCIGKLSYFRKLNEAVFVTDVLKYSGPFLGENTVLIQR